jgi:hypothetical protein
MLKAEAGDSAKPAEVSDRQAPLRG